MLHSVSTHFITHSLTNTCNSQATIVMRRLGNGLSYLNQVMNNLINET